MKVFTGLLTFIMIGIITVSCKKEPTVVPTPAVGTLKSLSSGDCNPSVVNGVYKKDTLLTADNYIDIDIDFTATGTYSIVTETLNAYSFSASGFATDKGLQTIRLQGKGRPLTSQTDQFHVIFNNQSCLQNVTVL